MEAVASDNPHKDMVQVVICLGSNFGDRHSALTSALVSIKKIVHGLRVSGLYETPAVANAGLHSTESDPYINAVAVGESELDVRELDAIFKRIEQSAGRNDRCRELGLVPLDIDIVCYGGDVRRPRDYRQPFFQIGYKMLGFS